MRGRGQDLALTVRVRLLKVSTREWRLIPQRWEDAVWNPSEAIGTQPSQAQALVQAGACQHRLTGRRRRAGDEGTPAGTREEDSMSKTHVGDIRVEGNMIVPDAAVIKGSVQIKGNVALTGELGVEGPLIIYGKVVLLKGSRVEVGGNIIHNGELEQPDEAKD